MRKLLFTSLAILGAMFAGSAHAAFDANATGNMIWGDGNNNGGFTTSTSADGTLELAVRAKVRYPAPNDSIPNGIKSQGNGTYGPFDAGNFGPETPAASGLYRASWNFDFSINSDTNGAGTGGSGLNGYIFVLELDFDPSAAAVYTNATTYDPLLLGGDTEFGTNATPADGGIKMSDGSFTTLANYNLAQNSWNYRFAGVPFDPTANAIYSIRLSAYSLTDTGLTSALAQTEINVQVGNVPEAASIAVWSGLGACAMAIGYWRKKRTVKA